MLGLPPFFDHLFDMPALPSLGRGPAGLLRPGPAAAPLTGLELRGCWEAGPARSADAMPAPPTGLDAEEPPSPALRLRDFVPVELVRGGPRRARARGARSPPARERGAADRAGVPAVPRDRRAAPGFRPAPWRIGSRSSLDADL